MSATHRSGPQQLGGQRAARGARPCRWAWRARGRRRRPAARRSRVEVRRRRPGRRRSGRRSDGGEARGRGRRSTSSDGQPARCPGSAARAPRPRPRRRRRAGPPGRAAASGSPRSKARGEARTSRCCGRPPGRRARTTVLTAPSASASGESSSRCGMHELLAGVGDVQPVEAGQPGGRQQVADGVGAAGRARRGRAAGRGSGAQLVGLPLVQGGRQRRADAGADETDEDSRVPRLTSGLRACTSW